MSELVVDQKVLLRLRYVCPFPPWEAGAEGVCDGGGGGGAVDEDQAQQAAGVGQPAARQHVGPGALAEPYGVADVKEVQDRD